MNNNTFFSYATFEPVRVYRVMLYLMGAFFLFLYFSDCTRRQWDFVVYYLASYAIWHGENLYSPEVLKSLSNFIQGAGYGGLPYLYTPFFARILFPLQLLPYFDAAFVWLILKCLILEASLFMIMRLLWNRFTLGGWVILNLAACLFRPISLDYNAGNVAIFEMGLILAAFLHWRWGRNEISSFFVVVSGLMKGIWLVLVFYAVGIRKWNYIKWFYVWFFVLFLLAMIEPKTWLAYFSFFRGPIWTELWDEQVQSIYNCSSTTFFLRSFSDTYFAEPLIYAPWLSMILIPLFPIIVFIFIAKGIERIKRDHSSSWETSNQELILLILGILLLPPRLAGYNLSITFYPVIGLLWMGWKEKQWLVLVLTLIGLFFLQMDLIFWGFHPGHIEGVVHQLMVDKDFFGIFALFLSILFLVYRKKQVNNIYR